MQSTHNLNVIFWFELGNTNTMGSLKRKESVGPAGGAVHQTRNFYYKLSVNVYLKIQKYPQKLRDENTP